MRSIATAWNRLRTWLRRGTLEQRLDEEMRFHLEQQAAKHERAGMDPASARRAALVEFGGVERTREHTRDEIRPSLLDDSLRDARQGIRLLRRAPGFTAAALVTLALGIGGIAAIFSVVRAVMLEPLPYHQPDRLVTVWETNRGATSRNVIAPANFVAWRERTRTLLQLGMIGPAGFSMVAAGRAQQLSGHTFSADVFRAIGVQPALGRAYTIEEDHGGAAVVVVSHDLWERRLGGRRDIVGSTIATDQGPLTVVGVMPVGFTVLGEKTDFLRPYGQTLEQMRAVRGRDSSYAIGRLRDGVSFDQAASEMRGIYADLAREDPRRNARRTVMLFTPQEQMVGELRPAMLALVGGVVLVLLVACVNVANLLLARSASREREVGLRTALGAGRGRLVRQMLTESLVLAVAGGVAGLGVAALCRRGLIALVGDRIAMPRLDEAALDLPVIAFTMAAAVLTGLVFGLVPAFVTTAHARDALRDGGRHGGGRRLHQVLGGLVVVEVALSLVLLAGAGLLMRSLLKLQGNDLGFRTDNVLTADIGLPRTRYTLPQAGVTLRATLARLAALPGVESATGASCLPVPFACVGTSFWRADLARPADGQLPSSQVRPVTPDYFRTMSIPQRSGRDFSNADTAESQPVAIVSEELVRAQFRGDDPIGRRLRVNVDHVSGRDDVEWTIVGVVGDTKSTLDGPVRQTIFVPVTQRPAFGMVFFVRTSQDPTALSSAVTGVIHATEPEVPVQVRTLDDVVGRTIARPRAISVLVGVFALVALALAAVGVYGVMAYSVRERTQEIGVRMALGASAGSVFRLVFRQALTLVVGGVVAGLVAAGLLTRLMERLLYQVEPLDLTTFAATAVILLVVATVASYVPARRGMRMAPVDALRVDARG
jgi:putative ABC transport system permease protein